MRLESRWVMVTLIVAALLMLLGGVWYYTLQQQQMHNQVVRELAGIAWLKANQITAWRRERLDEGAELLERPLLRESISRWLADPQPEYQAALVEELRVISDHDNFLDVFVTDAAGRVLLSASGAKDPLHPQDIAAIGAALASGKPMLTELHADPGHGDTNINVVAPLLPAIDAMDTPSTTVMLVTSAEKFLYPLIQMWPTPSDSAETLLVERDGADALFLNNPRFLDDAALKLRFPLTDTAVSAVQAVLGATGIFMGRDYRGVDVVSYLQPIADSPWFIVSEVDTAEAFAEWRTRSAWITLLMLGLFAVFTLLVLWQGQRARLRRLQQLYRLEVEQRARERRYLVTLNSIGDGVIATDAAGCVVMLNPVAETMTGWSNADAQGRALDEVFAIIDEGTRQPVATPVERVLQANATVGMDKLTTLIARDGAERPIADSAAPIRGDDGDLIGVVLVFRDQSEERAARRSLELSESRLQAMVAAMPDLIFRIGRDFRYRYAHASDPANLYVPPETFIGRTMREVLPPENVAFGEHILEEAFTTGETQVAEYYLDMAQGREWFEMRAVRINEEEALVIVRNISERHRLEQLTQMRLGLLEYAVTHTLDELLQETLDRLGEIVSSPIGFFHFVTADQRTLSLQAWSTRTVREFCKAEGKGMHYAVENAGVWADALRRRQPVIHNDYATLPDRRGTPSGHAAVTRELVVPIERRGHVAAILGVGNKPTDYDQNDLRVVTYLANTAWEIVEQKLAAEQHRLLEQIYRKAITATGGVPYQRDYASGAYSFLGEGFERLTGYANAEMSGALFASRLREIVDYGEYSDRPHQERIDLFRKGVLAEYRCEYQFERKDGTLVWLADHSVPVRDDVGIVVAALGIVIDITERKRAEQEHDRLQEQLAQAQRLEAVGRLAGGVAHDFNNMLAVILMRTEMALQQVEPASPLRRHLQEIEKTANRSVDLTRQLLGYARRQTIAPQPIDLNTAIAGTLSMLQRLIGEEIALDWQPGPDLWTMRIDPSQLDQILTNLCVNGRDAIDGSGRIIIRTENVTLDEYFSARHLGVLSGDYVRLSITDDGAGMSKATLQSIFEPFFTTKELGRGTGLGLATVHGIVRQNDGNIQVYSEPGVGTTFVIHFPRVADQLPAGASAVVSQAPRGKGETVLLVEDETSVLEMGAEILARLGYAVIPANAPDTALDMAAAYEGPIDLLLTDVIMPGMSGKELASRMQEVRPAIKLLFMSGYPADFVAHRGILDANVQFIAKPFSLEGLATKVRAVLDGGLALQP